MTKPLPLVTLKARPINKRISPFGNNEIEFTLYEGSCIELRGPSGVGKSTISTVLTGINNGTRHEKTLLNKLSLDIQCIWSTTIPINERCGVLFQQTTLLDELTVAGNLAVALKLHKDVFSTSETRDLRIKQLLDMVGLNYASDACKLPCELSGGMGRRVCLALQLAQRKRIIVLDEPFTGLDYESAVSIAKELVRLRRIQNTALLLISHEPHLSKLVMAAESDDYDTLNKTNDRIIELKPSSNDDDSHHSSKNIQKPSLFGTNFYDRFLERLMDYTFYSLPLIVMAFIACGLAISMISADSLHRLDITPKVLEIVDKEVRPLIKLITGEEPNTMHMMGIKFKVKSMLNTTVPPAKAKLYAIGLSTLFVLEVGPLLTALLLCGRIGGSYAGKGT
jgi:ABC-type transporter Mla maintaining outer membrane lipid asymmetry ATPase subunit MlaF